jgi:hypothetical protein
MGKFDSRKEDKLGKWPVNPVYVSDKGKEIIAMI